MGAHALGVRRPVAALRRARPALLTVRVSQINWCAFCVDINAATCMKRGVGAEQFAELEGFATSPLFDERQKAALA